MHIAGNGQSYMEFSMQLTAVGIRSGSSDRSTTLGTWKAGFNNNISLVDPELMRNYTADIVYRVATVIVRFRFGNKTNIFYMNIIQSNLIN